LKSSLAALLAGCTPQPDRAKPWLAIDRSFDLKGIGTVVTGTLTGGNLQRGDAVIVQPCGIEARIRSIQTHSHNLERAIPGSRVALNLTGSRVNPESIHRGDVVTIAGLGCCATVLDVQLQRLNRPFLQGARAIRSGSRVAIHCGTAWQLGTVRLLDLPELPPGGKALARLSLDAPIPLLASDRLILRDASQRHTLAGGIVLDPSPPHQKRGSAKLASQLALLSSRSDRPSDPAAFVASQVHRDLLTNIDEINRLCRFGRDQLDSAAADLLDSSGARQVGQWLADRRWWDALVAGAADAIDRHHAQRPQDSGMPLSELRSQVRSSMPRSAEHALDMVMKGLIEDLSRPDYAIGAASSMIKRADHAPRLPPRLAPCGERIRRRLTEHPLDPPPVAELAPDDPSHQALRFLIAAGQVIELSPQVVISDDAFARAISVIRAHIEVHGAATVSDLKRALGSSRRVVVPLLERMDKEQVTQRQGDLRTLRRASRQPTPASA
ncbi:MAG TPA: SelB C-terminal domain-containing protein, partial [Tepidisphaeraceae bacterium]